MKIRDILATKGRQVHQVAPTDSIVTAIEGMAVHDIGSLLVIDAGGEIQGIVTERDCLRAVAKGPEYRKQTVESITTTEIAIAEIEDDLRHVVNTMAAKKCRHVPVVEDGKLAGMISVRDVINSRLNETRTELKFLRTYIQGPSGPGG
jgi:CBS domain-containing protein